MNDGSSLIGRRVTPVCKENQLWDGDFAYVVAHNGVILFVQGVDDSQIRQVTLSVVEFGPHPNSKPKNEERQA